MNRERKKGLGLSPGFWIRMWILVALGDRELHGYELISKISDIFPGMIGKGIGEMGRGYRILRELEMEGLITSYWDVEGIGPAKRVYKLTPKGEELRRESIKYIREIKGYIEKFIEIAESEEKKIP
ncbi:MAG: PadR family transcriptional regulator [Dictyoglomus sp.]|nr:PadR family transcriptional regulator [Dictyoglomus sp.]MCX7942856.1 PadR family transcriptional regulator [Dictyoglomaceae bacterium]MDW8189084.1 PadR family transcriptional regulator [Dictyoglomus sp.]